MIRTVTRRLAAAGVIAASAALLAMVTAAGPAGASQPAHVAAPRHRQIGVTELSGFKVILGVTRESGQPPLATVTAAGYRWSGGTWKFIGVRRIGAADHWFWNAVQTCSLDIAQYQPGSPVRDVASIKVSLLATPALGCTPPFGEHWTR